jgi:DNA-binding GntR family transcriptional regulator
MLPRALPLQAMERRDPEMARSAMRVHLEQVRQDSQLSSRKTLGKNAMASPKVPA